VGHHSGDVHRRRHHVAHQALGVDGGVQAGSGYGLGYACFGEKRGRDGEVGAAWQDEALASARKSGLVPNMTKP
jgi:hypothetical protein